MNLMEAFELAKNNPGLKLRNTSSHGHNSYAMCELNSCRLRWYDDDDGRELCDVVVAPHNMDGWSIDTPRVTEWQPIVTMPTDRSTVRLYRLEHGGINAYVSKDKADLESPSRDLLWIDIPANLEKGSAE